MANLVGTADVTALWAGFADLGTSTQNALIGAASAAVEGYCRRTFEAGTVTQYLDGTGRSKVWLDRRPVVSVSTVTINDTALDNSSGDAWTFDPQTGTLLRGNGTYDPRHAMAWPRGMRNVVVTYVAGYSTIPEDVKVATAAMAKHLYDSSTNTGVFSSESVGDYSRVLNTAFQKGGVPGAVAMVLAPYVQDDIAC